MGKSGPWLSSLIIIASSLSSLAGCKATGNWSFSRQGDGFAYKCDPFEGYDHCGLTFDMEALQEVLRHIETMFGKVRHALEGGPPDGRTLSSASSTPDVGPPPAALVGPPVPAPPP